jgi:beta-N-acetylhexosaminidase
MGNLGELYNQDPVTATQHAYRLGWLLAVELLVYGIDYSYAPVLDLDGGVSEVIGNRAFHQRPQAIIELTQAFTDGMHEAGMPATGKHFPGHGAVAADSHTAVPVDHRPFDELWQNDLLPYRDLIQGRHLDAIMTAHVIYDAIDSNAPCFSPFWLQQILRQRLEFDGVIVSDDLTMAGAATVGSYAHRAELALEAGCDMLLICNKRQAVLEVLQHLTDISYTIDPISSQRIEKLYGHCHIKRQDLSAHADWQAAQLLLTQTSDI